MTNLKPVAGIALVTLSLFGCGSDDSQSPLPADPLPIPALPTNGQVSADQLKDSAVLVDGYQQITINSDSKLTLQLDSNETFSLDSNEKLVVDGHLRITSN
ncbi:MULTISPECIES: hypothetical protein [Vibrio]|uniref:hypothetical protein n=1 Tax=Vibrio TaxID=662 RepID=UPI00073F2800|nr:MULTISPECIES: hypothetical protein [Vibrio]MCK8086147.1 hypothetical protein [Vibrio sp. 1CM8B]